MLILADEEVMEFVSTLTSDTPLVVQKIATGWFSGKGECIEAKDQVRVIKNTKGVKDESWGTLGLLQCLKVECIGTDLANLKHSPPQAHKLTFSSIRNRYSGWPESICYSFLYFHAASHSPGQRVGTDSLRAMEEIGEDVDLEEDWEGVIAV